MYMYVYDLVKINYSIGLYASVLNVCSSQYSKCCLKRFIPLFSPLSDTVLQNANTNAMAKFSFFIMGSFLSRTIMLLLYKTLNVDLVWRSKC